jgi:hypothetical protein
VAGVDREEMYRVFNMGIGLVIAVRAADQARRRWPRCESRRRRSRGRRSMGREGHAASDQVGIN